MDELQHLPSLDEAYDMIKDKDKIYDAKGRHLDQKNHPSGGNQKYHEGSYFDDYTS
jgi:hypothetical protein